MPRTTGNKESHSLYLVIANGHTVAIGKLSEHSQRRAHTVTQQRIQRAENARKMDLDTKIRRVRNVLHTRAHRKVMKCSFNNESAVVITNHDDGKDMSKHRR